MAEERVIFLDIDGVICCNMVGHLEETKLAELSRIVTATGAKVSATALFTRLSVWHDMTDCRRGPTGCAVSHGPPTPSGSLFDPRSPLSQVVLSTDWRRHAHLKKQLRDVLGRMGIDVIGATPMRHMFHPVRPQEILSWLAKSTHVIGAWVAIDDRDLLHESGEPARLVPHSQPRPLYNKTPQIDLLTTATPSQVARVCRVTLSIHTRAPG